MTEEEYIVATTLARVYALRELIRHIMPDNRWAPPEDIQVVNQITSRWESLLQKHCKTTE